MKNLGKDEEAPAGEGKQMWPGRKREDRELSGHKKLGFKFRFYYTLAEPV